MIRAPRRVRRTLRRALRTPGGGPPAPRRTVLRRALRTRRAGWQLAAALALLGVLLGAQRLGWHRLTRAAGLVGHVLAQAARLALDAGWLLLLLAAAGLAASLAFRIPARRTILRRLPTLAASLARWLLGGAALLAVLVLVVAVLPPHFTAARHFNTTAEELKAQNDVRTTLLQALAGALLATGAYLTWRQLRVTREGQITDRYTKAVDQLGHDELDVRLGGIYALERIARDSPHDRATIEEVLTAFVRSHAPWPSPPALLAHEAGTQQPPTTTVQLFLPDGRPAAAKATAGQSDGGIAERQGPAADVQATVTVLGRRQLPSGGLRPLDLTGVDFRCTVLAGANLQGARLNETNLQDAQLDRANLQGAVLAGADLQGARLADANLRDAGLRGAKLQGAWLADANLRGAWLIGANLQDTTLLGAKLQGAVLDSSNLERARLSQANLQGAKLASANLESAGLFGANLQGADLRLTNLQRTLANKDTRWPAGWTREQAEARGVQYSD